MSAKPPMSRSIDWAAWLLWISLFVVLGVSAYAIRQRGLGQAVVWVANQDLPAYHRIAAAEVMTATLALSDLPEQALPLDSPPPDAYTRQPIKANQVLRQEDLVTQSDPALTRETAPLSIPADAAMTFYGALSSGTVVRLWAILPGDDPGASQAEVLLPRALVLDVHPIDNPEETQGQAYVVILAAPIDRQAEVLAAALSGSLTFTLPP